VVDEPDPLFIHRGRTGEAASITNQPPGVIGNQPVQQNADGKFKFRDDPNPTMSDSSKK
jgi:hypothetical protein